MNKTKNISLSITYGLQKTYSHDIQNPTHCLLSVSNSIISYIYYILCIIYPILMLQVKFIIMMIKVENDLMYSPKHLVKNV